MVAHIETNLVLGIAAGAGAALCYDGANVLQAREARAVAEPVLRASLAIRLLRRPRWLAASALAIAGWPLQILALSVAPLTVVQPTLAIGLLLLFAAGARLYHERVTRSDLIATLAVLAGVAGIALCAPGERDATHHVVLTSCVIAGLALAALAPLVLRHRQSGSLLIAAAGAGYTAGALATNLLAADFSKHIWTAVAGWGVVAASAAAVGLIDEMGAMQRMPVARVAVPIFVVQIALPVALAPLVADESWSGTPGGGAGILAALLVCSAGAGWLGRSPAVDNLLASTQASSSSVEAAAEGRSA